MLPRVKVRHVRGSSAAARYQLLEDLRHTCVFLHGPPPRFTSLPHLGGQRLASVNFCLVILQRVRRFPWRQDPVMRATNPILGPRKTVRSCFESARNAASIHSFLKWVPLAVVHKASKRRCIPCRPQPVCCMRRLLGPWVLIVLAPAGIASAVLVALQNGCTKRSGVQKHAGGHQEHLPNTLLTRRCCMRIHPGSI